MKVDKSKFIYIIIPVHNRQDITLRCLECLKKQEALDRYSVLIVDDGSTDGTGAMIESEYPEVHIIQGNGTLWWTGAIRKGMEYAYHHGADYIFWMNDDTFPSPNTLSSMIEKCKNNPNTIVSAQCYSDENFQIPTYGGQKRGFLSLTLFHTPSGQTYPCDCMSGNLVCFPRSIVDKIGLPPSKYLPHQMADILYTWKAKKEGYDLLVCGNATAICEFNPYEEGWSTSNISMLNRWQNLLSYKSNLYPPAFWYFCIKFHGTLGSMIFFYAYFKFILFSVIRLLVPRSVLTKTKLMKQKIFPSNSPNNFLIK